MTAFAPGDFCWAELATTDAAAAKQFYAALLGWAADDIALPQGVYSRFKLQGGQIAGVYEQTQEMQATGVPPHWLGFVAVEDAQAAAQKAVELGGSVLSEPFDMLDFGKMALLRDPSGVLFAAWQAGRHAGFEAQPGVASRPCALEIITSEPDVLARFYAGLFGWEITLDTERAPHWKIEQRGQCIGALYVAEQIEPHVAPTWLLHFRVEDCTEAAERAQRLNAKLEMPPHSLGNRGKRVLLRDPNGASFAVVSA